MIFPLITVGLIVGTAFLLRNATTKKSLKSYVLVFIAGFVTFLFEPVSMVLFTDGTGDGGAIQIVSTILGVYSIVWSIIQMIKLRQVSLFSVIKNFFSREDLKLQKRWWHRAFLVITCLVFLAYVFDKIVWSFDYDKKFSKVGTVDGYVSNEITSLYDLVDKNKGDGQVISGPDFMSRSGNDSNYFETYKKTSFCSKDTEKLISSVLEKEKRITEFYLMSEKKQRFPVTKDTLISSMQSNNIKCVSVDFYTGKSYENVFFLEPIPVLQNLSFDKFSFSKTLLNALGNTGTGVLVLFFVITFYYKVLLYIIFGSKRND